MATRHSFPDEASGFTRACRREAEHAVAAGNAGEFADVLNERWHPGVVVTWTDGRRACGRRAVAETMDAAMAAGVRQRLVTAVAGHDLLIREIDVLNPPGAAGCPPRACWLLRLEDGRVRQMRLFHPGGHR